MKIVTTFLNPRYSGIVNAVNSLFGGVTLFDSSTTPASDFFYKNKPDLMFVDEKIVNEHFLNAIEKLDTKIILFGNSVPEGLKPDLVCGEPSISPLMKKHLEREFNCIYILDYIDVDADLGGSRDEKLSSPTGILFLDNEINIPTLEFLVALSTKNKLKIVSDYNLSLPSFVGSLSYERRLDFLKSIDICIDLDGSQIIKNAANGVFTLSLMDNKLFPTINPENFQEQIDFYLQPSQSIKQKRDFITDTAKSSILSSTTNYHRLLDIINSLDFLSQFKEKTETKIQDIQK